MRTFVILIVAVIGGEQFAAGMRAYREARYADALAAFTAAETDAGDSASAELRYNKALAALRTGALQDAEVAAEACAARGGPEFEARRDFILGNISFLRGELAELAAANQPDAGPAGLDSAIAYVETARDWWRGAVMNRGDWAEARRNVERASRKLADLREKKKGEKQNIQSTEEPEINPRPLPIENEDDPDVDPDTGEEEVEPEAQTNALTPKEVSRLMEKLAEKEAEKTRLRREHRRTGRAAVARDW